MKLHYVDTPGGQVHARVWAATQQSGARQSGSLPLLCLHPCPYSGGYFETIAPMLSAGRDVLAPDFPGHGGSSPPSAKPTINAYAAAMQAAADGLLGTGQPFDIMGFHTGCLVGAELAVCYPERVGRMVLIDAPFFSPEQQQNMYPKAAHDVTYEPDLASLADAWSFSVEKRLEGMSFDRAFANFIEQLRAGKRGGWGFHAAFTYDCEVQFKKITVPTTVIITRSGLREATLAAAQTIAGAQLCDLPQITRAVMEEGAQAVAQAIEAALARD